MFYCSNTAVIAVCRHNSLTLQQARKVSGFKSDSRFIIACCSACLPVGTLLLY